MSSSNIDSSCDTYRHPTVGITRSIAIAYRREKKTAKKVQQRGGFAKGEGRKEKPSSFIFTHPLIRRRIEEEEHSRRETRMFVGSE